MSTHWLEELLRPRSVAVVGASGSRTGRGFVFLSPFIEFGFKGKVYPVNPKYPEILGFKSYPSVKDIPDSVDYVISTVPASEVLQMLDDCSQKNVKIVHLYTARFSETGRREAAQLEQDILKRAKQLGIRIIGPNCMGVYYPQQGLSFRDDLPKKSGKVGLISQSGNLAGDFIEAAALRGVYFSKAISYGNAIDLNECDYLDYLAQDEDTNVVLMYVEGVKDGKRFFNSLRQTTPIKPVIILKGGRGKAGTRSAFSHTASLAGATAIWQSAVKQAGGVTVDSFEEMIDMSVSFNFLPSIKGKRVGVAGGGGGSSVLAADHCEEAGLEVIPLPNEIREELKSQGNPIWDWIGNPGDVSIRPSNDFRAGEMLKMMAKNNKFDLLIAIMGVPFIREEQDLTAEAYLQQYRLEVSKLKPLLAVVPEKSMGIDNYDLWMWKLIYEVRTKLIDAKIPFYPTIGQAALSARKLIDYYRAINTD